MSISRATSRQLGSAAALAPPQAHHLVEPELDAGVPVGGHDAQVELARLPGLLGRGDAAGVELRGHEHTGGALRQRLEHVGDGSQRNPGLVVGGVEGSDHGDVREQPFFPSFRLLPPLDGLDGLSSTRTRDAPCTVRPGFFTSTFSFRQSRADLPGRG